MNDRQHDEHELRGLLSSLREEPVDGDGDFGAELHRRLVQAGVPPVPGTFERLRSVLGRRPMLVGLCAGACAGAAVFFALRLALPESAPHAPNAQRAPSESPPLRAVPSPELACAPAPVVEPSVEVFVVPAGKVAMVQLLFAVDREVQDAEFSVLLPAALSFFSDGEALAERSFHWVAPLTAGDNRVPIAIIGQTPGKHRVTAIATIAGEVVVHEVVLDVQEQS